MESGNLTRETISHIYDHIYLSGMNFDKLHLQQFNIKYILRILSQSQIPLCNNIDGIIYLNVICDDNPCVKIGSLFDQSHEFIDTSISMGSNVLVHCYAGVSRSATIVISYLMKTYNMTYNDAFSVVKLKRPIIDPNFGFCLELMEYEETLFNSQVSTSFIKIDN
jgi:protein-tyrosine phosphatase